MTLFCFLDHRGPRHIQLGGEDYQASSANQRNILRWNGVPNPQLDSFCGII